MNAAFAYADQNGYDYFTTVMTSHVKKILRNSMRLVALYNRNILTQNISTLISKKEMVNNILQKSLMRIVYIAKITVVVSIPMIPVKKISAIS